MDKRLKFFVVVIVLAMFFIFALVVKADVAEPGSEGDPLVTKSYVDKVLSDLKQYIDSKAGSPASFEIVYMEKSQQLIGDRGTEIPSLTPKHQIHQHQTHNICPQGQFFYVKFISFMSCKQL